MVNPTDDTRVDEFQAVISAWADALCCEMTTQSGVQCRRTAHWRLNLHGCEQALLCGQHLTQWRRTASARGMEGDPRCAHCGFVFDRAETAYSVTAL